MKATTASVHNSWIDLSEAGEAYVTSMEQITFPVSVD